MFGLGTRFLPVSERDPRKSDPDERSLLAREPAAVPSAEAAAARKVLDELPAADRSALSTFYTGVPAPAAPEQIRAIKARARHRFAALLGKGHPRK